MCRNLSLLKKKKKKKAPPESNLHVKKFTGTQYCKRIDRMDGERLEAGEHARELE